MDSTLFFRLGPLIAIAIPGICGLLILLFSRRPNLRETATITSSLLLFLTVLALAIRVMERGPISLQIIKVADGLAFALLADTTALIFAVTSSFLWIVVSVFATGYMRSLKEHAQTRFFFCFAVSLMSAVGIAMSANLLTLFLFYEFLTISTYPLVAHKQTKEAISAGHKYLAYLFTGGMLLLFATVTVYVIAGTTDFMPHGILNRANLPKTAAAGLFILFLAGFAKAAWMPIHSWLPSAMVAPTPVSALLHAVAVVKAGVFGIIRVTYFIFGYETAISIGLGTILCVIAAFTIIVANLFAIGQGNIKRMLAYSTINQLSFILLGTGLLHPTALTGALMYIPFHGFMKITLFLCAGALFAIKRIKEIADIKGAGRIMPYTMAAFAIAALGICGVPPVAGFTGKWLIAKGSVFSGNTLFIIIILAGSLLDVIYFFPVIRSAFFEKIHKDELTPNETENPVEILDSIKERPEFTRPLFIMMVVPLMVTAVFSVLFFFFPNIFYIRDLAIKTAELVF